jgi:hypothetical protein
LPEIEKVRKEYEPKGVGFLALALDRDNVRVKARAAELGLGMKVAVAEWIAPNDFKVVPSTLFVDAKGNVVDMAEGPRDLAYFQGKAAELLKP